MAFAISGALHAYFFTTQMRVAFSSELMSPALTSIMVWLSMRTSLKSQMC